MSTMQQGTKSSEVFQFCFCFFFPDESFRVQLKCNAGSDHFKRFSRNLTEFDDDLGMIGRLLNRAMEKCQSELFLPAFLLARQITVEKSGASYGTWFSSVTSSSTSSKNFALLIKFLSSIARYEPVSVLKAHLNNPPFIPMVFADCSCYMVHSPSSTVV